MILVRHAAQMARSIGRYTVRSGRWWVPAVAAVWVVAAFLVLAAKVVVPTAVYTLF